MNTKNYAYGLRAPVENRELVLDQLRLASQYRNRLVEIELKRRAETDAVLQELCPGLLECEAELASVTARIEDVRAQQRGRNRRVRGKTDDTEFQKSLQELQPRERQLKAERKRLRSGEFAKESTQARLTSISKRAQADVKDARLTCGVFWGTYLQVEQAADSFRKGAPPVFRGFRGTGRVAVQLQKGLSWEQAVSGKDTRLRLVPTPQTEPRTTKSGRVLPLPGAKRQAQLYTLWLRVGSDGVQPIWAKWPLILHRTPPEGAKIMWAIVHRILVAGHERWQLTLTLSDDTGVAFQRRDVAAQGVVGIDIGYRLMPDGGQRVAYWRGSDGASGELTLPAWTVAQWNLVEDLQSIRDTRHNEMRAELKSWLDAHEHPEWLRKATETMHAWKRLSRLDGLVVEWRSQRFAGDGEILAALEAWRTKERHLWQYQENLRDQLMAWRRNHYRNFAAQLRRQYRTIAIEDMDLRSAIHDVLRPEEERETVTAQRRMARFAALSIFVGCLKDCGSDVIPIERAGTTDVCHHCEQQNEVDERLMHTCVGCGRTWDRDDNASRNILARGLVAAATRASLATQASPGVTNGNGVGKKLTRSQRLQAARKARSAAKTDQGLG